MQSDDQIMEKPHVIVIGLDSMNGIQTARIFASYDVPVIAIAKDATHYNCRTNVCEKILIADTSSDELIQTLETVGPSLKQKGVLVPCTDMNVLLVSRNRERLRSWFHVVLPPAEVIETLMNKVLFYNFAQEHGFKIPQTRFLRESQDVVRAAQELRFPCVLKPPISDVPKWDAHSPLKAYKLQSQEEFLLTYERVKDWSDDLIVQEWIVGNDTNLYSCNCYLDAQLEPLATFVARKIRQWPPVTGESSLGEECRDDVVLDETIRLFKKAGLHGLGYVEFKQDERNGNHYILEPNVGRPTGRSAIAEAGGVELLYTMYCDVVGLPLPDNRTQHYKGVKWISLRRDLQSSLYHWREGKLSFRGWLRSIRGKKAYALFSRRDPAPFIGDLIRAVRLYLIPEERKKRDYRNPLS
jgi:predicted ATP-grasp superfamily ATP-dependent carboligase